MVETRDGQSGFGTGEASTGGAAARREDAVIDVPLTGGSEEGVSSKSNLVTARGTGDGLIIRLDGRVDTETISQALREYVSGRKDFLTGNDVVLEWVGKKPGEESEEKVTEILSSEFSIKVRSSRMKEKKGAAASSGTIPIGSTKSSTDSSSTEKSLSLFDGIEALSGADVGTDGGIDVGREVPVSPSPSPSPTSAGQFSMPDDSALWDEADTRVIGGTLRSGQKIESDHSLVILGDVNSGAELVAGGDIVVLGKLRGVAHAGAYDETGGGRFIFALELQPTQLRIGTVISRGAEDGGKVPEVAKVDGNLIVVEPYNSRSAMRRGGI